MANTRTTGAGAGRGRGGRGRGGRGGGRGKGGKGGGEETKSAAKPPGPKRKRVAASLIIPSDEDEDTDEDGNPKPTVTFSDSPSPPAKKPKKGTAKPTPTASHRNKRPAVSPPELSHDVDDDDQDQDGNKRQRVDSPVDTDAEPQEQTNAKANSTILIAAEIARTQEKAIRTKKRQAEASRPPGSRTVTFDVHRAKLVDGVEQGKGYIFFYSGVRRYGGPFDVFSNFYPSKFRVESIHKDHYFVTMEQFYQFCKAAHFQLAPEIFVVQTEGYAPLSSYGVADVVLVFTGAVTTANFVRKFISLATKQHPEWSSAWEKHWTSVVSGFLRIGLEAKFAADEKLMDVLQRTGNYELVRASPSDKRCGIGFAASVAFEHRDEWEDNKDCNLLGQALMAVRDAARIGNATPKAFDRAYFNTLELDFWQWVCQQQAAVARAKASSSKATSKAPAKKVLGG